MIIINGWICVSVSFDGDDPRDTNAVSYHILELIKGYSHFSKMIELKRLYPVPSLFIGGEFNRDLNYSTDLYNFMIEVGRIAPASYGIVYVRLPEAEGLENEYQVYRLAKSKVDILKDIYLSPCNPIIED